MTVTTTGTAETNDTAASRTLGVVCVLTAVLAGILLGLWERAHPVFSGRGRFTLTPSSALQLWTFGTLQALKAAGFIAGLVGIYLSATHRGVFLRVVLSLAGVAGAFFAFTWIMIAITGRDDALYIAGRAVGSDARTNGGAMFLWLTPIVLGVATLRTKRIAVWKSLWLIATGVIGSRLFGQFLPGTALVAEGALWSVVGYIAYAGGRSA
ncbi:MAG: hypothetical protein ACJ79A_06210 [Gemmatimonadaceae bacterium]